MNVSNKSNFLVQIIGINGVVRSSSLIGDLKKQDLDVRVLNGVIPTQSEIEESKFHNKFLSNLICQRQLSLGEVGCASSHKLAATNLLNSNYKFGLTFEDDAEILINFNFEEIESILSSSNPVIINLGWIPGYALASEWKTENIKSVIEVLTPPTCAFAYAYNKAAADLMVNDFKKIIDVADWPINLLDRTTFYLVNPAWAQASQNPANSTIGQRVKQTNKKALTNFFNRIRLLLSLVLLFIWVPFTSQKITIRQVVHRLVLRDFLFKIGKEEIRVDLSNYSDKNIVFLNPKIIKVSRLIKRV